MSVLKTEPGWLRTLELGLTWLPIVGTVLVVVLIGWDHSPQTRGWLLTGSRFIAGIYGLGVIVHWLSRDAVSWTSIGTHWFRLTMAVLLLLSATFEFSLGRFLQAHWTAPELHIWLISVAALQQVGALAIRVPEWLPVWERAVFSKVSPGLTLVLTFGSLIVMGTALLKMPNATTQDLSWIDAFFTSTSAVCVTGLIVVDTATAFTPLGQGIILLLIQLGAFGIVVLTFFLAVISGQGFSVAGRVFLRDLLSVENMRSLSATVAAIIGITLLVEAAGAAILWWIWRDALGSDDPAIWIACFHSVSAFCNAGFSIFTAGLADPRAQGQYGVQAVIMCLIVLGGLGFPVILEVGRGLSRRFSLGKRAPDSRTPRLSVHTRLVCTLTPILIAGGMLLLFLGGSANADPYSLEGLWESLFNSVTARTAGFNISDIGVLPSASTAIIMLLMFIGGSPGGIAGGIKTTTFAIALLNLRRILLHRREVQMYRRRIDDVISSRAFAVVLASILWIFSATTLLLYLQPNLFLIDALFECVSAFATVGLSRGITAELTSASKLLFVITMLVGRVGILNFFFSLLPPRIEEPHLRLPRERIIVE